jgi:hypothetical protein
MEFNQGFMPWEMKRIGLNSTKANVYSKKGLMLNCQISILIDIIINNKQSFYYFQKKEGNKARKEKERKKKKVNVGILSSLQA